MRLFFYSFILLFLICGFSSFSQVIVPAFHGAYTSKASAVVPSSSCGAYVAAGIWKEFMCHNLGADTSLDPHVPVQGIHGNHYQWGIITPVATSSTPAGTIALWNTTAAANSAWLDGSKTAADPCPAGFRVPTNAQWAGVVANNTVSRSGIWADNTSNFTTVVHFGTSTTKTLTLPAAGFRDGASNGMLSNRGSFGFYWASTENASNAGKLYFNSSSLGTSNYLRTEGHSVRCVSE